MKNKENNKPFVFLCTGMSLDGKISTFQRKQSKISTDDNKDFLFDHRIIADAIMMGGTTIALDDPSLNVKTTKRQKKRLSLGKSKEPTKVAVISNVKDIKKNGSFLTKGEGKVIVFTTQQSSKSQITKLREICDVYVYGKKKVNLKKALEKLYQLGIKSLLVEGGGELISSLLKDNLVDEINLKIGDIILGGRKSPTLCDGEGFLEKDAKEVELISVKKIKSSLILKYKIKNPKK